MSRRPCSYFGCNHPKGPFSCSLHKLPKDRAKCLIWMQACGINGTPRKLPAEIFYCSCHFVGQAGPTRENPNPTISELLEFEGNPKVYAATPPKHQSPKEDEARAQSFASSSGSFEGRSKKPSRGASDMTSSLPPTPSCSISGTDRRKRTTPSSTFHMKTRSGGKVSKINEADTLASFASFSSFSSSFDGTHKLHSRSGSNLASSLPPTPSCSISGGEVSKKTPASFEVKRPRGAKAAHTTDADDTTVSIQRKKVCDVAVQTDLPFFTIEECYRTWSDKKFTFFTGISKAAFNMVYDLCGGDNVCTVLKYRVGNSTPKALRESTHSPRSQLFLTLLRLRRGYPLADLALFSGVSDSVLSEMFHTWIRLLSIHFQEMEEIMFATVESQKDNQPDCYKPFPNVRCVVDSTVIKIEKPKNFEQQSNTFCMYKGCNAVKVLIATTLYGGCAFVSDCFEGSMSDRKLFLKSGIMKFLNPGDAIMCDRGFDIAADLNDVDVDIIMPPFLGSRQAFTEREMALSKAIATSRIHVETFIGRVKDFRLIRYTVENTMLDIVSDIVRVCACLVNFSNPFIQWHTDKKIKKI